VRIHICGVRGSTPAPGPAFLRYGGHTSCLGVAPDAAAAPTLILDAGTGLCRVSALLRGEAFAGTILLSHLHWDHFQGLPFFRAGDRDDAKVILLVPENTLGTSAEELLAGAMSPPHFPIRPSGLRGHWTFETVVPGRLKAEGYAIEAREVPHKGGRTLGYRISDGDATLAYIPDHCPTVLGPGPDGWGEYHQAALDLAAGVDLLVHDASLLPEEAAAEASFGHAVADYAVRLGELAGARRVLLAHHKHDRTDDALDRLASRYTAGPAEVIVAAEGGIFDL
jgi:phosphoribosyl 1,2-cyclic phosphodiesterase